MSPYYVTLHLSMLRTSASRSPAVLLAVLLNAGCVRQQPIDAADSIYTGGDILTMNDRQPTAEALAVKGALIPAVGTLTVANQVNSAALEKWGISARTETPSGGIIVRKPGTNEPHGPIMETAYLPIFASLPQPTREQEVEWSKAGQNLYARHGCGLQSTACPGLAQ